MEDNGELTGNGHACLLKAECLGQLNTSRFERGEAQVARQQCDSRLVEMYSCKPIALFGDAAVTAGFAGLTASRCEAEIGVGT
ncbi:hypothetical protein BG46_03290 [Brucella anthropi]|nr:hypothetical protein BG46_03290 [Brucella anthropi]